MSAGAELSRKLVDHQEALAKLLVEFIELRTKDMEWHIYNIMDALSVLSGANRKIAFAKGKSKQVIDHNAKKMIREGTPRAHAVMIAHAMAGRKIKLREPKR